MKEILDEYKGIIITNELQEEVGARIYEYLNENKLKSLKIPFKLR